MKNRVLTSLPDIAKEPQKHSTNHLHIVRERKGNGAWVQVQNVSKSFETQNGRLNVLDSISFEAKPGEFLCLLGPSGCGKSTLLNLVAGLEAIDTGTIMMDQVEVESTGPDRLVIFQEGGLFPWLTVQENVEFGLKMKGVSRRERSDRAGDVLKSVGLEKFLKAYPHQLSGGMKQRAAIARGLVLNPKVLLMDEPFAALDAQTRDRLHEELQIIWQRSGKTILFVTHNVREAACLADRILMLCPHPGRIYKEYTLDLPRPRVIEGDGVMNIARQIQADLKIILPISRVGEKS